MAESRWRAGTLVSYRAPSGRNHWYIVCKLVKDRSETGTSMEAWLVRSMTGDGWRPQRAWVLDALGRSKYKIEVY